MRKEKIRLPKMEKRFRLLLYLVTLISCTLSVAETVFGYFPFAVEIVIYVAAAVSLAATCFYLVQDMKRGIQGIVKLVIEGNALANRVYSDYRYRTVLFTFFSFLLNLFYAVSNGVYGFINHSPWMGTFSAYYIFLSIMRYGIISYDRKLSKKEDGRDLRLQELKVYRNTGILLSLITIALGGAVILLVTIRNIGYADALVSVLSLQTAMFGAFGENSNIDPTLTNGITGACVCMMILAIGIYMIRSAGRQRKRIQADIQKGL